MGDCLTRADGFFPLGFSLGFYSGWVLWILFFSFEYASCVFQLTSYLVHSFLVESTTLHVPYELPTLSHALCSSVENVGRMSTRVRCCNTSTTDKRVALVHLCQALLANAKWAEKRIPFGTILSAL
jgi:hypothetical protein